LCGRYTHNAFLNSGKKAARNCQYFADMKLNAQTVPTFTEKMTGQEIATEELNKK
jgi:hypothetical protein